MSVLGPFLPSVFVLDCDIEFRTLSNVGNADSKDASRSKIPASTGSGSSARALGTNRISLAFS